MNEIAWIYLVAKLRKLPVNDVDVRRIHDQFSSAVSRGLDEHRELCGQSIWSFANDLIDAVFLRSEETGSQLPYDYALTEEDGADFRIEHEQRLSMGYIFLLYRLLDESVRVGKNTRREVHTQAAELEIDAQEAEAFFVEVTKDLLQIIFMKTSQVDS